VVARQRAQGEAYSVELPSLEEQLTRHDGDGDAAAPARLVAVQMAVAGGSRGDVDQHLRRALGVEEPGGILEGLFGQGSDAETRAVWADKVPQ
jgi:hypothetical protein